MSTASFPQAFPPDVADFVAEAIITGSPFANSLTRRPSRGDLVIPVINSVTGQAWVLEGADLPSVTVGDASEIVAVEKLGGIVMLTREAVEDNQFDLQNEVTRAVQGAFSHTLDDGLLNGSGTPPSPKGVLGRATVTDGPTLTGAVAAAVGEIGEAGGSASHVALSPTTYAAELAREGDQGAIHPTGLGNLLGLTVVQVPGLTSSLVYDATTIYLAVGRDFRVDSSGDYAPAFVADKVALRVTGRFGVGVPSPAQSLRKLTVTPVLPLSSGRAAKS